MLVPEVLTVLRGDEAQLTCSTSSPQWTVMVWLLNDQVALTITNDSGVLPSVNPSVTAKQLSPNSWTFILKNTSRLNQGVVTCDLQGIDRKRAELFVQGRCLRVCVGGSLLVYSLTHTHTHTQKPLRCSLRLTVCWSAVATVLFDGLLCVAVDAAGSSAETSSQSAVSKSGICALQLQMQRRSEDHKPAAEAESRLAVHALLPAPLAPCSTRC